MLSFSKANAKLDQLHDVDELQYWLQDRRKVYSFDRDWETEHSIL